MWCASGHAHLPHNCGGPNPSNCTEWGEGVSKMHFLGPLAFPPPLDEPFSHRFLTVGELMTCGFADSHEGCEYMGDDYWSVGRGIAVRHGCGPALSGTCTCVSLVPNF